MSIWNRILPFLGVLFLSACGHATDSYQSQGLALNSDSLQGTLTLPDAGLEGGRSYITYDDTGYYIDLSQSLPSTVTYLRNLLSHSVTATGVRNYSSSATLYSVHFTGAFTTSPCTFNSNLYCRKVILTDLQAD